MFNAPRKRLEWLIIGSKMSLEKAKQKLDMYYTIRHLVPELFKNRDPRDSSINVLHDVTQYVILPKLTPENRRICILQPTVNDASKFDPWLLHKYMFMVGDIRMIEDRSAGDIYVYDLEMISLGHIMKLTPTLLKKCEVAASKAYAARIKSIHLINAPPFVDRIVTMIKSVLKPKLAARVHVHAVGDLESFHRLVPKSILPKDYGGSYSTIKELSGLLRKKVDDYRDWFLEQENVFADERLRPGPTFDENDIFGFSGSFRKLSVD
ncbi:retinol-binding protein pinta-like isoform X2 [Diprion similis]|uniref:retinol-binding protein pinta-like isoform X2 n=1 Tax=Diprion similis TaxID=362088 RepID=UPI001EF98A37|nr:retinol-binding protein pinta-like isoform X2 [Diprion similis]